MSNELGTETLQLLRQKLQERIFRCKPDWAKNKPDGLLREIRSFLNEAHGNDILNCPQQEIFRYVTMHDGGTGIVRISGGLVNGRKPFSRLPDDARIIRADGAWLHFTLMLRCSKSEFIEDCIAYDFELIFPEGHQPPFVRFDLNEPGHDNEKREIRSHLHPGNDDLQLPAPVMSPLELLDILIYRCRHQRDPERPRQ